MELRLLCDHFQWPCGPELLLSPPSPCPSLLQTYESECPSNGRAIARVQEGTLEEYSAAVDRTRQAWGTWVEVGRGSNGYSHSTLSLVIH